jgi:hypothetical protein
MAATFRCRYCGRFFRPDPRKRGRSRQKTCGRQACRQANERRRYAEWIKRHPGYEKTRRLKRQGWAKGYPGYWRRYRREHPEYRQRDNERRRVVKQRARRAAKQTARREILVEKLLAVKRLRPLRSANQTVIARRVEALVDVLVWRERSAKQSLMGWMASAAG